MNDTIDHVLFTMRFTLVSTIILQGINAHCNLLPNLDFQQLTYASQTAFPVS